MLQFSNEDEEVETDDLSNFIGDKYIPENGVSFYRQRDPQNLHDYLKFHDQTRDPIEAVFLDTKSYFGEDNQPEPFCSRK